MTRQAEGTWVGGFDLHIYDRNLKPVVHFLLPFSVVAPFANRVLDLIEQKQAAPFREPWYWLIPLVQFEKELSRSPFPEGPTSLCGGRYVPEEAPPPRVRLHTPESLTHFLFRLEEFGRIFYEGIYTVDDIFLAGAEFWTRQWIQKGHISERDGPFFYGVRTSPYEVYRLPDRMFPPEAYQVEGVFRLPPLPPDRKRIQFHKITPPPFPERPPEAAEPTRTTGRGAAGLGHVRMAERVFRLLERDYPLSAEAEQGGFLVGDVFRPPGGPADEDDPDFRWEVDIVDLVPAEWAFGKPLSLLFTGETWSRIIRRVDRDYPGKQLVGWFHTHLFAATDDFGLSGLDQDLHRNSFRRPWQIAILVNIEKTGDREVRCFQKDETGRLAESTFQIHSPAKEPDHA
jgi:hypothetical protein